MEYIGAIIFVLVAIYRGFRWVLRQTGGTPTPPPRPQVPPNFQQLPPNFQQPSGYQVPAGYPQPAPPQAQRPPFAGVPGQGRLQSAPRPALSPSLMPRQPEAGGPAVFAETDTRDFERQERELVASEAVPLGVSLSSASQASAPTANALFGGTDDLVRAIILQEVLGPPLSRRAPRS